MNAFSLILTQNESCLNDGLTSKLIETICKQKKVILKTEEEDSIS